jgi:glycerol-3-phosphate dehydrogenase
MNDVDVAVIGAGVVGCATALALARRGASVVLLEAEREPGLAASGTNSGILHTGFDSIPGELETELILRSAVLRVGVLEALGVPVLRCGALLRPRSEEQRATVTALATNAERNGVEATVTDDGALSVPGEAVTDPVAHTLALAAAAVRYGAVLHEGVRVEAITADSDRLRVEAPFGPAVSARVVVNAAGLHAGEVARMVGDESFDVFPRKGEFLVFDPPAGERLEHILLPVPTERTKGVLVFPTVDGKVVAGPTAVDQDDRDDWSVRPQALEEIWPGAVAMWPPLEGATRVASYAGLRPAGRGVNYVIAPSRADPRLINAAAIRSTGLTASLGVAERVCELVAAAGVELGPEQRLRRASSRPAGGPWWARTAAYRAR